MPRRTVPDGPGKRVALLSRTTIELRKQLEHAASLSGRSLGQEVERRLQLSFDEERFAATVQAAVERGLAALSASAS